MSEKLDAPVSSQSNGPVGKKPRSSFQKACIVGAASTPFGRFVDKNRDTGELTDTKSFYQLIEEAGLAAIEHAGLQPDEIDGIWLGACSPSRFVHQEHVGPLGLEIAPGALEGIPTTRTEAACASSSVALYDASYAISSGRFRNVLVVGVEKMNMVSGKEVGETLACSSHWPSEGSQGMTFPDLFARLANAYKSHWKIDDEELRGYLAHVAAQAYRNGVKNPLAHFGPGSLPEKLGLFSAEAILGLPEDGKGSNRMVSNPLRLHDCAPVSDGAAAVVLTSADGVGQRFDKAVELSGIGHVTSRMALKDREVTYELAGAEKAAHLALGEAGLNIGDVDLVELHDCFTIAQILATEALGLADKGTAGAMYSEGRFSVDDRCPINLSGGLKSKGHPVGATGASMHALVARQLMGEPIGLSHSGSPEVGLAMNIGGSGVTNCVSVMKRIH